MKFDAPVQAHTTKSINSNLVDTLTSHSKGEQL